MPGQEIIGKISIQAVPGSIGAMFAQSELGGNEKKSRKDVTRATAVKFLCGRGRALPGFQRCADGEMILIAHQMSLWHSIALAVVSLLVMHAFVYALEFHGTASIPPETRFWSVFLQVYHCRVRRRVIDEPLYTLDLRANRRFGFYSNGIDPSRARVSVCRRCSRGKADTLG